MLEIILIVTLTKRLAAKADEKGRSKAWAGLLPLFWIGGEVIGFAIGAAMMMGMGAYGLALLGAAVGAISAWVIVSSLGFQDRFAPEPDGLEGEGTFDMDNPYSPPGTYQPATR